MGYQAIIFDLDGVLCHTDEYHYQAWKAMADGLGVYFDPEINNRLRGVSRMDSLEIILEQYNGPELNQAEKLALAEKKNELYRQSLAQMTPDDLSGEVKRTLDALRPGVEVTARACPLLVSLVENGRFRPGDIVAETVVAEYLTPIKAAGVDALILGCTHYPLMRDIIGAFMGPGVTLVDAGEQCARWVKKQLEWDGLRNQRPGAGRHRWFVSDSAGDFSELATVFLGEDIRGGVEQIDITAY